MSKTKVAQNDGKPTWSLAKTLPWLLLIGGIIAMVASLALSIEVFDRLKNPSYVPICNLNPVLSCTSVADSAQSEVFGFPNYYIGIAGFASLATIGLAMLAGAKFKRWFWVTLELGLLLGIGFVIWLQFQSLYRIGALCIFCMVVWAMTIPIFWYTTLHVLNEKYIKTPAQLKKLVAFATRHHGDVLLLWFLVVIGLIVKRFWYYWSTLL
ncbi:vitamin K epoxide reductase family protein [Candidatus Saccharibacteria bacterium]|nr:vitamin K epoxide reductase family protein [Candidatus Saccharibacteria bacterium]